MIAIKEDIIRNFVDVVHTSSNDKFRLHKDDLSKIGTTEKVAVFEKKNLSYLSPSKSHPKGKFRARVKFFVASYLKISGENVDFIENELI